MAINWAQFTPWSALGGGLLIGLSAAMLLLFSGRIAGISGIIGGLLQRAPGPVGWRIAFITGLVVSPVIWTLVSSMPAIEIEAGYGMLVFAGLIVGFGTRLGSGCTSGHGVCGLSRFSPRSLAATLIFMATGFVTVYALRHVFAV